MTLKTVEGFVGAGKPFYFVQTLYFFSATLCTFILPYTKRPGDERETSEAITSGRVKSFDNADDAIKWLESDEAKAWADAIARNYGHHDPTLRLNVSAQPHSRRALN